MIEPTIIGDCTLYHGDNRDVLRQLPSDSLDSCVTDPPYALVSIVKRFGKPGSAPAKGNDAYMRASAGFMNCNWDTGEVAFSEEFWAEVLRVLKPGGHVAAFGASRGYHRMACAIEDAGFEIRDSLMWVYGTGFPKSHDVSKGIDKAAGAERELTRPGSVKRDGYGEDWDTGSSADRPRYDIPATDAAREWEGWGTALKPAFEPIVLARKPLSEGTVAANVLRWGTGALNIDGCRVPHVTVDGGNLALNPHLRSSINGGNGGQIFPTEAERRVVIPDVAGRWPANVVHDGSDEVVGAFPSTGASKAAARGGKNPNPMDWGNDRADGHIVKGHTDNGGSAARFFYSAKASKADRAGSKHPTVKPVALMEWLARLITPPGGTILDLFAGSGTTGAAAVRKGFKAVLCEREDEYVEDIKRRLTSPQVSAAVAAQQPANDNRPRDLFGEAA